MSYGYAWRNVENNSAYASGGYSTTPEARREGGAATAVAEEPEVVCLTSQFDGDVFAELHPPLAESVLEAALGDVAVTAEGLRYTSRIDANNHQHVTVHTLGEESIMDAVEAAIRAAHEKMFTIAGATA